MCRVRTNLKMFDILVFHEALIIKILMSKCNLENQISAKIFTIWNVWSRIWDLHTWITLVSDFLSIYTFSNGVTAIVKFVPLVLLMAQVAGTHMDRMIWSEICLAIFKHYTAGLQKMFYGLSFYFDHWFRLIYGRWFRISNQLFSIS